MSIRNELLDKLIEMSDPDFGWKFIKLRGRTLMLEQETEQWEVQKHDKVYEYRFNKHWVLNSHKARQEDSFPRLVGTLHAIDWDEGKVWVKGTIGNYIYEVKLKVVDVRL